MTAERILAQLAHRGETDDPDRVYVGRVTQATPLYFRIDGGTLTVGPVSKTGSVTVALNDQIAVLYVASSRAFMCIGKITRP